MGVAATTETAGWALLTDLYELTMAYGYWQRGMSEDEAVFYHSFREAPFGGHYALACGLGHLCEMLVNFHFVQSDRQYLASLRGADDRPLFSGGFLDYLMELRWTCDLHAVQEGTVVFANEPLVRVRGPLVQAQLVESLLLNAINFQTLIATKAARICQAADPGDILEFGLRRAQGESGALAASRAAYIGGCDATSNVLAGKRFGIPVRGTHAHSWVLTHDSELEAFESYARAMPNNCILLVDTFDTIRGVAHAIEVGHQLHKRGHKLLAIRLDSGDLNGLSRTARRMLDEAGLTDVKIVASNDLDEYEIRALKQQGAEIDIWGVGTRLVTAYDQPALGGVYKLAALRDTNGDWQPKIKLSEQPLKISTPGILQTRRYQRHGRPVGDVIFDEMSGIGEPVVAVDAADQHFTLPGDATGEDQLVPIFDPESWFTRARHLFNSGSMRWISDGFLTR